MTGSWQTERLLLRDLGPESAAAVRDYGLRSRDFHAQWDPLRSADFWELPVVAERLRSQNEDARAGRVLCLCVSLRDNPEHIIGAANLRNIIRGALLGAQLGYGLAPDAVGHGYMTEAVEQTVRIAFAELGLHRVELNIMPRNGRSLAVAERTGFVREGFSPRYLRINGAWEDHLRFARVNEGMS